MQGWRRHLFLLELLVLFGPCSLFALLSVLYLGLAVSLILGLVFGTVGEAPWWMGWLALVVPVGALAGVFALAELARALVQGRSRLAYPPTVIGWMAASGVTVLAGVGAFVAAQAPTALSTVFLVYLPLVGTVHVISMSWRRRLFTTNC